MRRAFLASGAVAAVAAAAVAGIAYHEVGVRNRSQHQAETVVSSYLRAWSSSHWADASALTQPARGIDPAAYLSHTASGLHLAGVTFSDIHVVTKKGQPHADFATVMAVQGAGTYDYQGHLVLTKAAKVGWRVRFDEASVHPSLAAGTRLVRLRDPGKRGAVLGADGRPLAALDQELAANVVGQTAAMTAKDATAKGIRSDAGDLIGSSGLERSMESTLASTATASVAISDAKGTILSRLKTFPGKDGADLRTTFDLAVQSAGERALASQSKPGALVAIDTRTGAIKAIVNSPLGGFPRAVAGAYPPGSTFKIITSTAALMNGRTSSTTLTCPKSVKVEGRTFVNAEKEEFGSIPFIEAFAQSCNTAFAGLVRDLPLNAVGDASKLYGFTESRDSAGPLPLNGIGGYFPKPAGFATAVGQAIGQDQVVASPIEMASVAAAISAGQWRQPFLTDPAPPSLAHHDIPVAATIRSFMAAVVSHGTAAHAGLPPGTFGKTGTAEFGPGPPYKTHAWFVGYRGPIAFAIVIEGGGFGGEVAAPLAAGFLRALPS